MMSQELLSRRNVIGVAFLRMATFIVVLEGLWFSIWLEPSRSLNLDFAYFNCFLRSLITSPCCELTTLSRCSSCKHFLL